jgi:hypothetical protein
MLSTSNSRPLPASGTIDSLMSLRDALRNESITRLARQFHEFLEDATREELAFLAEALSIRNECTSDADSDGFRLASAIEFLAGNAAAIPTGSLTDEGGTVMGWATVTSEETKRSAEGAAV